MEEIDVLKINCDDDDEVAGSKELVGTQVIPLPLLLLPEVRTRLRPHCRTLSRADSKREKVRVDRRVSPSLRATAAGSARNTDAGATDLPRYIHLGHGRVRDRTGSCSVQDGRQGGTPGGIRKQVMLSCRAELQRDQARAFGGDVCTEDVPTISTWGEIHYTNGPRSIAVADPDPNWAAGQMGGTARRVRL